MVYFKPQRLHKATIDLLGIKVTRYIHVNVLGNHYVEYFGELMKIDPVSLSFIRTMTRHTVQRIIEALDTFDTESEADLRYIRKMYTGRRKLLETFYPTDSKFLISKIEGLLWEATRDKPYAKINKNI